MNDTKPEDVGKSNNPIVGDFSGPSQNTLRTSATVTQPVVPEVQPKKKSMIAPPVQKEVRSRNDLQSKQEKELSDIPKIPEKSKEEVYRENLEHFDISIEHARRILDGIFCENYYQESGKLGNRLEYVLRTRQATDMDRALAHIENLAPKMAMTTQDVIAQYNLAASLVSYGKRTFTHPQEGIDGATDKDREDAFYERLAFVKTMAGPALERMISKVAEFDIRIGVVTSDGAPEDF